MKHLVQLLLKPFGLRLNRVSGQSHQKAGLDGLFSVLKKSGFSPQHILDVGANHGHWTRKALDYFPEASYTLVEPQDHLKQYVQDLVNCGSKIQWIHGGAGDQSGMFPFTISQRDDSSTFSPPRQPSLGTTPRVSVQVRTLNEIVGNSGLPMPDMVKIDAEGFDLKVLAGASELFGQTDIFLVEATVCCTDYQNTVLEVVQFMAHVGYRLIDITELNRSPRDNVLWLCELAFLRTGSLLLNLVTSYE
jgi:FkbM family methyltransferase